MTTGPATRRPPGPSAAISGLALTKRLGRLATRTAGTSRPAQATPCPRPPGPTRATRRPAPTRHAVGARQSVRVTGVVRVPQRFRVPAGAGGCHACPVRASGPKGACRAVADAHVPAARKHPIRAHGAAATSPRQVARLGPTRLGFDLRTRRSGLRVPRACAALPRSVQPRPPIVRLETRLRVSDGRRTNTRVMRGDFACVRDRRGNISHLRSVSRRVRHRLRPGLRGVLRLPAWSGPAAPRSPGSSCATRGGRREARRSGTSMWRPRASNRDAGPARRCGRPFGGYARAGQRACSLAPPRATLGPGPVLFQTTTTADLARASSSRRCARVRRAAAPPVTG